MVKHAIVFFGVKPIATAFSITPGTVHAWFGPDYATRKELLLRENNLPCYLCFKKGRLNYLIGLVLILICSAVCDHFFLSVQPRALAVAAFIAVSKA